MGVSLLRDLEQGTYEVAFFLTYSLNLRFFESLVLPRLRRAGIRRTGIIVDRMAYDSTFSDPLAQEECGLSYIVAPVDLAHGGLQHAKAMWLQGNQTLAYIGSHNLTTAGFNDQLEITAKLDSKQPEHSLALADLHDTISKLVPSPLRSTWSHVPRPHPLVNSSNVHFLSSLQNPLMEQVCSLVGVSPKLRVVTPFLDAETLKRISDTVRATKVVLDVPEEGADTRLADAVELIPSLECRSLLRPKRRLHAKVYEFTGGQANWLALGSANCTKKGMGLSVSQGGNLEFLLLGENATLHADSELEFASIVCPEGFPYTSAGSPFQPAASAGVCIEAAEYREGKLYIRWQARTRSEPESILISFGDASVSLSPAQNSIEIPCDLAPRSVTICAVIDGRDSEARAWVSHRDSLEAEANRQVGRRWIGPIAAMDPVAQAIGIGDLLELFRRYLYANRSDFKKVVSTLTAEKSSNTSELKKDLEQFTYSKDIDTVLCATERFIDAAGGDNPFAFLRALAERSKSPTPSTIEDDPAEVEEHAARRRKAAAIAFQRLADHFVWLNYHKDALAQLAIDDAEAEIYLRLTFAAPVLIWFEMVRRQETEQNLSTGDCLVSEFIAFLSKLAGDNRLWAIVNRPAVVGLLLLSLGAINDIASSNSIDQYLQHELAKKARTLFGADPRPALAQWRTHQAVEDTFVVSVEKAVLTSWERPLLGLFGIAIGAMVQHEWRLLIELQQADIDAAPDRDELFEKAQQRYAQSAPEIWSRYVAARTKRILPAILYVEQVQECPKCHLLLPKLKVSQLKHGKAVLCEDGHILMMKP